MKNADYALLFKAMSDETRLRIINMLSKENLCACHILEAFNITQPTLSYHMKILVDSGIVESKKDGNWTRYYLNKASIREIQKLTSDLLSVDPITRELDAC
ncbi:winged helix-turn-helix transcriptional regulator [Erysipelothrix sp. HDW6B]|uniref:ArsR/SmtB family transcription factor n=1 Tax=Erysipelothrix sp. HDW6B TaxID=2714929 RepID=UPI001407F08B|nr:metalloregulator ArsR/SmtB family transcription factor [Erysipelothrix sp. HDW6B]QIK86351.1 winged helix-turn-helix transcriptional regulator [Erysipelothrix sp. HDW6B]